MMLTQLTQYLSWIADGQLAWTLQAGAVGANPVVEIGPRPIPQEPMVCLILSAIYND